MALKYGLPCRFWAKVRVTVSILCQVRVTVSDLHNTILSHDEENHLAAGLFRWLCWSLLGRAEASKTNHKAVFPARKIQNRFTSATKGLPRLAPERRHLRPSEHSTQQHGGSTVRDTPKIENARETAQF